MKIGYLQNIQSFETSLETGNLKSYEKQSILTAVKVTLQQVPSPPLPSPPLPSPPLSSPLHATVIDYCPDGTITIVTLS